MDQSTNDGLDESIIRHQGNRLVQDESTSVDSEIALKSDKFVSVSTQTEPLEKVSLATQMSSYF